MEELLRTLREFLGFSPPDQDRIHALAEVIEPAIPDIVDRFYRDLLKDPQARAVFTGGEAQLQRQRRLLADWLRGVLRGSYDLAYFADRQRIGTTHLRTGVPQHYMVTGMEVLAREIDRRALESGVEGAAEKLASVHKLLALELAVMLETYKEHYSEQVRQRERSAVEAKLTRAEHLAELGQLAASLAHEIKNPLAGISGAIQIMRDAIPRDDAHQPILGEILAQVRRLDETVKDLLQYARPSAPRRTTVSLREAVERVVNVVQKGASPERILVACEEEPGDTELLADRGQIEQLIMNLVLNAVHATEQGGDVRVVIKPERQRLVLQVEDTGKGMTPAVLAQAFEPFFTTKARGTGLGLSICRRIADAHQAEITLVSQLGEGTTVTVVLPRRPREAGRTKEVP